MTLVTRLEPVGGSGGRVRVHLDGEARCELPPSALGRLGLEEGRELSEEEVDALLAEGERRRAIDVALEYLAHRPRSRAEVERRLAREGLGPEAVAAAVERCVELDYLDDRAFAADFARDRIRLKPRGSLRIVMELRKKGVSEADARAGVERAFRDEGVSDRELLERAARKRWESRRSDDPRVVRRRLWSYLRRRGFRTSEIRDVVEELVDGL